MNNENNGFENSENVINGMNNYNSSLNNSISTNPQNNNLTYENSIDKNVMNNENTAQNEIVFGNDYSNQLNNQNNFFSETQTHQEINKDVSRKKDNSPLRTVFIILGIIAIFIFLIPIISKFIRN